MSGNQAYHYDLTAGHPFLIPVPNQQVPPPHPPPSPLGAPGGPESAPLGSFQNPYPANSIPTHILPPALSTSTSTTHHAPTLTSSYGPPHHTQTAAIPIQYFQPTPLPCRCATFSAEKGLATGPTQDYGHVSSTWWPSPPAPASSEAQRQKTMMLCTRCAQDGELYAAPASEHPIAPSPQTLLPRCPAQYPATDPTLSLPQPQLALQPQPPPSTYPKPIPSPAPPPPPPPSPRPAKPAFPGPRGQMLDLDVESAWEWEGRKWADCYVCNEKPALREKEGVLFCLGCWAEAE